MKRVAGRLAAAALGLALAACGGRERPEHAGAATPAEPSPAPAAGQEADDTTPLPVESVTVYFPSASADLLTGEARQILATREPGDRIKQIVTELIAGPQAPETALSALPPGTILRQVFVLPDGTVWVDFSGPLRDAMPGGIENELLTVYAVVDSVALNVPEAKRVGILLDGAPLDTLNGHIDLRRPLPPERSLVAAR